MTARGSTRRSARRRSIVEPADGELPPLTPEAQRKRALAPRGTYGNGPLDGPEDFTFYDRCISLGVVGSLTPKIYGNGHRIIQTPGYVAIMNEMIHETRVIPLDNRPHPGKNIRMYMGDSRGHWEGNTLVVETTNLNGKPNYSGQSTRTLVERFTRVEPDVLRYEAIIDDPKTYTRTREDLDSAARLLRDTRCCPMSVTKGTAPCVRDWAASAPRTGSSQKTRRTGSSGRGGRSRASWASAASRSARRRAHAAPGPVRPVAEKRRRRDAERRTRSSGNHVGARQRSPGDGEAPDIDNVRPSPSFVLTNMPPFDPSRSGR